MERPLIQMRFGGRAIGPIEGGDGFGFPAIGRDLQDLMPTGCPAIGSPGEEVGYGGKATGISAKISSELRVRRSE